MMLFVDVYDSNNDNNNNKRMIEWDLFDKLIANRLAAKCLW